MLAFRAHPARHRLTPWTLAAGTAVRLVRDIGVFGALRLGWAGLRQLGAWGVVRRAAAGARQREDDQRYQQWRATHAPTADDRARLANAVARLSFRPRISIIVPVYNTEPQWLRLAIESVRQQVYPDWELCLSDDASTRADTRAVLDGLAGDERVRVTRATANGGIARASNAALAMATGEFVGFLDHDDELAPEALAEIALCLDADPGLDIIYTDEDKIALSGEHLTPHFKPDWSPELLRSCMYTSHFTVMRRQLIIDAGAFRAEFSGSQDYDLMLRASERTERIAHIAKVLYGWRMAPRSAASSQLAKPWAIEAGRRALEDHARRTGAGSSATSPAKPRAADPLPARGSTADPGLESHPVVTSAGAAGHFRVRYPIAGSPLVSILVAWPEAVPRRAFLEACVASLRAVIDATAYRHVEFIVALGGLPADDVRRALRGSRHQLLQMDADSPRTRGAVLNRGARESAGEHIVTLDPAVAPLDPTWLESLLELSQQPAIGAVGAFLLNADDTIAHAGLVVGAGGMAADAFLGEPSWTRGHLSNALDIRNCSAVSAACLMTSRAAFVRVGGFDDRFGGALCAVDYGLRLRRAGLRIVVTPHARLVRHEAPAVMRDAPGDELDAFRAAWGAALDRDPYYNPHFDRTAATFRLPAPAAAFHTHDV